MIEIVLRRDIAEYEPRPFFGFTGRQILTAAVVAVVACGSYALLYFALGVPASICGYIALALGAGIGFLGFGRVRGLKPESWLRITMEERSFPKHLSYAFPCASGSPASPYEAKKPKLKRADKRALKLERERVEYCDKDLEG